MPLPVLPVAADFVPPVGSSNSVGAIYITTDALARTTNGVLYCEDITP